MSRNTNNFQFGYDFYKSDGWLNHKVGIGQAYLLWDSGLTYVENNNDIDITDFKIAYKNIKYSENIPKEFFIKLNTYNEGDGISIRRIENAENGYGSLKFRAKQFIQINITGIGMYNFISVINSHRC